MGISGVRTVEGTNYTIFYIDNFSNDFKEIIREQLQGIWSGFEMVDTLPEFYSYKNTLKSFIDRFENKGEETRKGIIGEFLAHLLINNTKENLTSLSIMKNKEERSIKKGFDIIYCHIEQNKLWYSEVKSGKSENGSHNSTTYNEILLNRAKTGIASMIEERRNSLWESALIDVTQIFNDGKGKIDLLKLLSNDSPEINLNQLKNVILISVLYHDLADEITSQNVEEFHRATLEEGLFNDTILISIQKNTFETVSNFLIEEARD